MKSPKKSDLYKEIDGLKKEQDSLKEQLEQEKKINWEKQIPLATGKCQSYLNSVFPNLIFGLRFEHVDASGYWFSFELTNDSRRQNYVVRHDEL